MEAAKVSGDPVTEEEIAVAVEQYYDRLHEFREPPANFTTFLAHAWVRRGPIFKVLAAAVAAVVVIWGLLAAGILPGKVAIGVWPRLRNRNSPSDSTLLNARLPRCARSPMRTSRPRWRRSKPRLAPRVSKARPRRSASWRRKLAALQAELEQEYTLAIASRPGEQIGTRPILDRRARHARLRVVRVRRGPRRGGQSRSRADREPRDGAHRNGEPLGRAGARSRVRAAQSRQAGGRRARRARVRRQAARQAAARGDAARAPTASRSRGRGKSRHGDDRSNGRRRRAHPGARRQRGSPAARRPRRQSAGPRSADERPRVAPRRRVPRPREALPARYSPGDGPANVRRSPRRSARSGRPQAAPRARAARPGVRGRTTDRAPGGGAGPHHRGAQRQGGRAGEAGSARRRAAAWSRRVQATLRAGPDGGAGAGAQ